MSFRLVVFAAALLAAAPLDAHQNDVTTADAPEATAPREQGETPADSVRHAVPRMAISARQSPTSGASVTSRSEENPSVAADDDQRRRDGSRDRGGNPQAGGAVQRGDRPRGDSPATGRAVPRASRPAPVRPQASPRGAGSRTVYVAPRLYNYYSNPRRYYPYGYGAFGLGYFYYDPYTWYPPAAYSGIYGWDSGYVELAEVRLAVSPRSADVYVDGYFAGSVDEFDGVFQALKIEPGAHHIQIVAPGYLPIDLDVRVNPGQKITYRGDLRR